MVPRGTVEFAVGVRNLEQAAARLCDTGVDLTSEQSVDVETGEWLRTSRDPDDPYVSIVEAR